MKRKRLSIKWHLFLWLAVFVVVTITLLWVFQVIFLDDFYKFIKTNEIKVTASAVADSLDDESNIETIAKTNDISVMIYDEDGQPIYSTINTPNGFNFPISAVTIKEMAQKAKNNGGIFLEIYDIEQMNQNNIPNRKDIQPFDPEYPNKEKQKGNGEGLFYIKIAKDATTNENVIILINARITPVDATVNTLQIQLICVTVILLAVAVLLAVIIAKKISKPIEKISEGAKELAQSNYDVRFDTRGYKEVAELGETLNYAAGELNKTENLRRELIANVSHDLRTPLTLIAGYGEAIRDLPGENNAENVQIIIDESRRLTTLVNDMLDLSKLQNDSEPLNIERFSLTELISDILNRFSKLVADDGFTFTFSTDRNVLVEADKIKLSQVIYNFLTNAVNYSGNSKEVAVRQIIFENNVRIEVEDKGEGIEENELPYIWDRYYKSDKPHKRAVVGTGIGLSIVKKILQKHGLRYGVMSEIGKGSIFWFEMKIV